MKTLVCDICKRAIQNPVKDRNYFHIKDRDLCEPCKEQLEMVLRPILRTKHPFNFEWYDRVMTESIEKAIQKGKFDAI